MLRKNVKNRNREASKSSSGRLHLPMMNEVSAVAAPKRRQFAYNETDIRDVTAIAHITHVIGLHTVYDRIYYSRHDSGAEFSRNWQHDVHVG